MDNYLTVTLLPVFLLCSSCNHDDAACNPGTDNTVFFSDAEGDAAFSFIDLGNLSVTVNDCEIKAEISLLNAPVDLIYNSVNVSDNSSEYQWEVQFDIDGDGTAANDITLAATHFKFPDSTEAQGNVPNFTQNNLWLISSDGMSGSYEGPISAILTGATLTLLVNISENPALSNILNTTPIRFEAYYNSSGTRYTDIYPDNGSYAN